MSSAAHPTCLRPHLRELLARDELLSMPGGFSPLEAMIAGKAGFESFFLAGSQVSWFLYGLPDSGLVGLRDVVDHARHVAARSPIPVLVDADTGYGNAINVYFAVQEFIRAGVAGVSIEDQESPKKSGTLAGRRCIPIDEAVGKIQAAVAARDALDPAFVVCARTDAIGSEGIGFDDALERCLAYSDRGKADVVWLNSVQTRDQLRQACAALRVPVLTIWGGVKERPTFEELADLGLRVILTPTLASSAAAQAAWEVLHDFRADGDAALARRSERAKASQWGVVPTAELVGTSELRALEGRYLPDVQRRDYENTFGHRPS